MLFNSFHFIVFFIAVTFFYYLLPHRFRWILLLAASYIFYMAWRPELIILIIFSTFVNYTLSLKIYKSRNAANRRRMLAASVVINFTLLFVFKYLVFFNDTFIALFAGFGGKWPIESFDVILPMGISFYTFQAAAYTIDVYRGDIKPVKNYGKFSLFITFFPQLVAGPIERSSNLLPQFYKQHRFNIKRVILGLKIMMWGFFKKVVIADRAAIAVNTVFNSAQHYTGLTLVVATVLFSFQLYCDFSGYSDIAVGSAKVLGFNLMKNFDRPYLSKSVREFWRRWHISLSSWFMDYVYIPLGGSRGSKLKTYRNLFVTFLVSGLWHGANWTYVIWGGMHGVFIIIERITDGARTKIKNLLGYKNNSFSFGIINLFSVIFTFGLVTLSFIFFRANSVGDAFYIFDHILWGFRSWTDPQYIYNTALNLGMSLYELKTVIIAILTLIAAELLLGGDIHRTLMKKNFFIRLAFYSFIAVFILTAGVFYNAGEFIYFQF